MHPLNDIDVIAPNFKRRLSGVTATVARLVPLQAQSIAITACAPEMPDHVPNVGWHQLLTMSRMRPRVWHARRNVEMIAGLALKYLLRKRLKLLFTSASQRAHTWLTRALIARMDAVIATSGKTAAYLHRPAHVILHGIDIDSFAPHPDRPRLRAELGLPDRGPLIGCFGRIRAQKGTDVFVEAMIDLCRVREDVTAIVMGRATEAHAVFLDELKQSVSRANLSDRILFLPEVPVWEVARYYQALDLCIAPQRWEGFGLTPLEAMATGCPVIATRVGAFEELLTPDTGCLIETGDSAALLAASSDLLDKLPGMRDAARRHVAQSFSLKKEADAINAVYASLLETAQG